MSLVIGQVILLSVVCVAEMDTPSLQEVTEAFTASSSRHRSIEATVECSQFWLTDGLPVPPLGQKDRDPDLRTVYLWRNNNHHQMYAEIDYPKPDRNKRVKQVWGYGGETVVKTYNVYKRTLKTSTHGIIMADPGRPPILDPLKELHYPLGQYFKVLDADHTKLIVDADGNYLLDETKEVLGEDQELTRRYTHTIDPSQDFVCTKAELSFTGTKPRRALLDNVMTDISVKLYLDYRRVGEEGLPFPHRILNYHNEVLFDDPDKTICCGWDEYLITDIRINEDFEDGDFDVVFPQGTHVEDRISNLEYDVEKGKDARENVSEIGGSSSQDTATPPASSKPEADQRIPLIVGIGIVLLGLLGGAFFYGRSRRH